MLRSSLALLLSALSLAAQELPERSPRLSSYRMAVELDPVARTVQGTQVITWRNTSSAATSELRFHMYLNAFRDLQSTLMLESDPSFRAQWRDSDFGSVEFDSLQLETVGGRVDLTPRAEAPDDGNENDATVLVVPLPAPVEPGASITLHSSFTSRMPKAYRRTGWIPENGFFCMNWFPKLGVLEQVGDQAVWNCHQFHSNTEFYADFSTYDVSITVPDDYVVGASGELQEEVNRDGKKSLRFLAEDVHDFAFVADPDFKVHEETFPAFVAANDPSGVAPAVAALIGKPVADFNLPETKIILLLHPQHDSELQVQRHMHAVKLALEFYGLRFGPYPYGTVTAVDPGSDMEGRRLGGGMEYPTIFTCGTLLYPHPRVSRPEGVTVHEFGHQFWYGLSANNEFEESWLDEGLNTYSEGRAQWLELFLRKAPEERPVQRGFISAGEHRRVQTTDWSSPPDLEGWSQLGQVRRHPSAQLTASRASLYSTHRQRLSGGLLPGWLE
ncbi:MAG: M1 family metallopeptidase [Planctomycetota bacterium]